MGRMPPPGGAGKPVHVLRVPADGLHRVVFLADYVGQIEHWDRSRTFACPGGAECAAKHGKYRVDWYAYAPVAYLDSRTRRYDPWVLQITACLEFNLRSRPLRGTAWDLSRAPGHGGKGEVVGELVEEWAEERLPKAFPIVPVLEKIFGIGRVYLGAPNPLPEPVTVSEWNIEAPPAPPPPEPKPRPAFKMQEEFRRRMTGTNGTVNHT